MKQNNQMANEHIENAQLLWSFSSVQLIRHVQPFATPWTETQQASLSITIPELAQTQVHQVSDAIQSSHPLSSHSPPAYNLSHHQGLFQ